MNLLLFGLFALVAYASLYIVSLYALAVNIQPDTFDSMRQSLGSGRARLLQRLTGDPRLFVQIGLIYKTLVLAAICLGTFVVIEPVADSIGLSRWTLYTLSLIAIWLMHIVVGELLPRRTSRRAISRRMVSFLWLIGLVYRVFYPVVRLYRLGLEQARDADRVTEEEKEDIVERAIETLAEQAGIGQKIVESDEKEMIGHIFLLDQTVVREIMIPRVNMVTVEKGARLADIQALVKEDGHSRYPVYDGNVDNIIGILYVKDLFSNLPGVGEEFVITEYLRKPMVVPESKVIGELLREFRDRKVHLAVAVDEFGGVAGLVTLEDILEEIVGEIQDEHDDEEPEVTELPDGSLRVEGSFLVEELQERLGTDYEQGEYDTVAGLIYDLVGSVPAAGEVLPWYDLDLEVERTHGQRIELVRVRRRNSSSLS